MAEPLAAALNSATQKLSVARTRLILDNPFLGSLVLRLPLTDASDWCDKSGTDAKHIYYNHNYINSLTVSQVQFVLSHEALHCGLSHFARREHRDRRRWDLACDHAVNQLLKDEKLEHPPGTLLNDEYAGLTAEEIYPCIEPDSSEQPMDEHYYDSAGDDTTRSDPGNNDQATEQSENEASGAIEHDESAGDQAAPRSLHATNSTPDTNASAPPGGLSHRELDQLDTQWQQRLASAAQQAARAGKLSPSLLRMLDRLLQPTLPWRALLARYMNTVARVDYNLTRPSRRREGDAILPSLHVRQVNIVVAIDTSGSVSADELNEFISELDAIKGAMHTRVTLLACDDSLNDNCPWIFEPWDTMQIPDLLTGGGMTDFRPVFDWLATMAGPPDLVVYFTDGKGQFPASPPAPPVLWLIKGARPVPWGQRIQLN